MAGRAWLVLSLTVTGALALAACGATPSQTLQGPPGSAEARTPTARATDVHFLQPDAYFVAEQAFEAGWMYVDLATPVERPTALEEGRFYNVNLGREMWTRHYWRSRPARAADVQVGRLVFCFDRLRDEVYQPPGDEDEARTAHWFLARVTDATRLDDGVALVGGYPCSVAGLRVPLP